MALELTRVRSIGFDGGTVNVRAIEKADNLKFIIGVSKQVADHDLCKLGSQSKNFSGQ